MKRIGAIGMMAVAVLCAACGNGRSKAHGGRAQLVGYETTAAGELIVHVTSDSSYESEGVTVTLPDATPVKVIGVQQNGDDGLGGADPSSVKVTVKAEYDKKPYSGWAYISNLAFTPSVLEKILKDTMKREPYTMYIVEHAENVDQSLAMGLMTRMCEYARVERDDDQRAYLFYLARTYLFATAEFDLASCDTPPLNLAAKYNDAEFLGDVHGWCAGMDIPIDTPAGVNANTALIEAAIAGNPECVEYLMRNGADATYKNAKGKTADDYMLSSPIVAMKNIAEYSRKPEDYAKALESLSSEDMRTAPDTACLEVPASVYIRFKKSGMTMKTADYDDFLSELSVREESGQAAQSGFSTEVFPFDGYVHTDDGSRLKVRDGPSAKGGILGAVSDKAGVRILSRAETPDDIDGKNDYWYKVRDGSVEGWCFGGYLSKTIPIEDSSLRYQRGYGEQLPLDQGDTAYALSDCSLRTSRDETVAVGAFEPLEILAACDPAYVSFGNQESCRYYLVKDANYACGIISGKYLVNDRVVPDEDGNLEFYLTRARTGEDTVTTRIFMRDVGKRIGKEIDFAPDETDGLINDYYRFTNVRIVGIRVSPYRLGDRDVTFVEFTCENQSDDGEESQTKAFFNIEDFTAHYALSVDYREFRSDENSDAFSSCSSSWNEDDPSEITILRYGRYYEYYGEGDDSAVEYTHTQTYTRGAIDAFDYALTNEEHMDELPGF